ncbi:TrbI/VirB10 family protein [Sphingomonas montanisoli]|uniref:TrbI/VirB10 family protein n=1 Tax=Sphingomonas montanisoli TaxID=2606412 RepID=A0A5D9C6Q9_9SPHN|nr:TrbI/VirB10 family protein [Sphingomonas montanisoli]TZG25675.1 TrbI/VirB10 family protein [Sphingomonas montanisoli]
MSLADDPSTEPVARQPIATRAPAPTPRRLSRKALVTLTGVSALGVAAALGYSLTHSHRTQGPQETVSIERRNTDALADAPKSYSDLPQAASASIGPPPATAQPVTTPPPDGNGAGPSTTSNDLAAERQRRRQSQESARGSKLFASTAEGTRGAPATSMADASPPLSEQPPGASPAAAPSADAQDRKAAFIANSSREPTINSGRIMPAAGSYIVSAGSTIAAALITGLSSDLPGQVVAQVTEDVFDSVSGRTRLIPQGTRLIGTYDARVTYGQSRALVVWTRMIFPDGRSIDLDRMIGTDAGGQSGFTDRVDNHTGKLLMAGLLSTVFGVGANAATGGGDNADIAFAIRESAGRSVESAGDKIVSRQLDVQPTITIRPGARVRVLLNRDLLLVPWDPD